MKMRKKKKWLWLLAVIAAIAAGVIMYLPGTFVRWGSNEETVMIDGDGYTITVQIDGNYISRSDLDDWMVRRIRYVEGQLGFEKMEDGDAEDMLAALTEEKLALSYDDIVGKLSSHLSMAEWMTDRIIDISGGKTKNCITVITVEGVDLDTFLAEFDRLQSENSPENLAVNLAVAPDHYYLGVTEDGQLEVIETCGNTPVQSRFFITYGDMDALNSIWDQKYEYQSAGVARTSAGRVEGGVRHQFTRTENGFAARLLVEFPVAAPQLYVKYHQMHLACEFSHWVMAAVEDAE